MNLAVNEINERADMHRALCSAAERYELDPQRLRDIPIGDYCTGILRYNTNTFAMFSARVGWYSNNRARALTDVASYTWCRTEIESVGDCVHEHARIMMADNRMLYTCGDGQKVGEVAVIASEDGDEELLNMMDKVLDRIL